MFSLSQGIKSSVSPSSMGKESTGGFSSPNPSPSSMGKGSTRVPSSPVTVTSLSSDFLGHSSLWYPLTFLWEQA